MDVRFQKHLLETQANEMVKYIEQLENNNAIMLQFIQQNGLGEKFAKMIEPKEEVAVPAQTSTPVEVTE